MTKDYLTFNEVLKKNLKKGNFRICLSPDKKNCSNQGKGIGAHSIQNNGILSKLSVEDHVYMQREIYNYPKSKVGIMNLIERNIQRIGVNQATTFFGFCNTHDTEIFKPIESGVFTSSPQENFLFAYRAFAFEYYNKLEKEYINKSLTKEKIAPFPNLGELEKQMNLSNLLIEEMQSQSQVFIEDYKNYERKFNRIIHSNDFSEIKTLVFKLPREVSIAVNSTFFWEFDLNKKDLNYSRLFDLSQKVYPLFFNVFPENGCSYALFSVFNSDYFFFEELFEQINNLEKVYLERLINNVTLYYCMHNTVISPRLFDSFSNEEKSKLIKIIEPNLDISYQEDNRNKMSLVKKVKVNLLK